MSTRGAYGFKRDNQYKVTYNHFDSYPTGLGIDIFKFVRDTSIEEMNKVFDSIVLVTNEKRPTKAQIEECKVYMDVDVSEQVADDWYCLLYNSRGNLYVYLDKPTQIYTGYDKHWNKLTKKVPGGLKYMLDGHKFLGDTVFCEWSYVINLTNNTVEISGGGIEYMYLIDQIKKMSDAKIKEACVLIEKTSYDD